MVVDLSVSKSFTLFEVSIESLLIFKLRGLILPLLLSILDWNLLGFKMMQLFVNHFIHILMCFKFFLINSCKSLEKAEMVLSLAKLCKSAVLNQRNKSLIKMEKRIGLSMEPCGTPESNSLKMLHVLLILTFCLCHLK